MVQFNTRSNEILAKIVYYGPGLSGKTTNLKALHDRVKQQTRSQLFSVDTMEDRTLFFDLMPVSLPLGERNLKFQVYTVPGQVHYDSTRRIILSGADGLVFVADSSTESMSANIESLNNLNKNLNANRLSIKTIPLVLQYNKRDLEKTETLEAMNRKLNFREVPWFPAIAIQGEGVLDTFRQIAGDVALHILQQYHLARDPLELEQARKEIDQYLENMASVPAPLKTLELESKDFDQTESTRQEDRTRLTYLGSDGAVSEEEVLQQALNTADDTAKMLNEIQSLKSQLEEQNRKLQITVKENRYIRSFLQSVFHNAGLPILTFNAVGKITNWNRECERALGYPAQEAKSLYFTDLIPEEALLSVQTLMSLVHQKRRTNRAPVSLKSKDQNPVPVELILSPVADEDGNITAITAILSPAEQRNTNATPPEKG